MDEDQRWYGSLPLAALATLLLVLVGVALRCRLAAGALFMGDEWHTLRSATGRFLDVAAHYDQFGSGIGTPLAVKSVASLLGWSELVVRLPALLAGVGTVVAVGVLGGRLGGRGVGLAAAALAAVNSTLVYYSAFARAYAVVAFLGVVAALAALRWLEAPRRPRGPAVVLGLCAALLPWFHLTGLSVLVGVLGATGALLAARRDLRGVLALAGCAAAGLALAAALFLPARESVLEFVGAKGGQRYYGTFGALDVLALHWGGRWTAVALVALAAAGALASLRTRGPRALVVAAAFLAPLAALVVMRPNGDPYAYARYAIATVPFACVLTAELAAWCAARLGRGEHVTLAVCATLAAVLLVAGPYGVRRVDDAPFQATYLSLLPMPAFDVPWPEAPGVYARIAADDEAEVVLEVPHLVHRSVHLYRNHALQHGKRVRTGFLAPNGGVVPDGYPVLGDPDVRARLADSADWLVLHLDATAEAERYWDFVFAQPDARAPAVRACMERHERFGKNVEIPGPGVRGTLVRAFGPPDYRDDEVLAWRLFGEGP